MSLYSKQEWYCNNCGRKMFSVPHKATLAGHSNHYSVCGFQCSREMQWKHTLSLMGVEYYPPKDKTSNE
jgi:hypothetical protein